MKEQLAKSAQAAALLSEDLRQAHKEAVKTNQLLEVLLRDKLAAARKLEYDLSEISASLED